MLDFLLSRKVDTAYLEALRIYNNTAPESVARDDAHKSFNDALDSIVEQISAPDQAPDMLQVETLATEAAPEPEVNGAPTAEQMVEAVNQLVQIQGDISKALDGMPIAPEDMIETGIGQTKVSDYSETDIAMLRTRAKQAYSAGDLEIPEYMLMLDLIAKKEYLAVEKILDGLIVPDQPGLMATKKAKGKADLQRLLKLIGSQMYANGLAEVSIKELVQNSFDAVRASIAEGLETEAKIDIILDQSNRLIAIRDNGRGMTPKTIRDAFLTLAGTEKEGLAKGESAGGGFGMAKAAFLLGNERIWVNTQRNGINSTFSVDANDIFGKGFDIEETPVAPDKHGTVIIVKVPEEVEINDEMKTVWFPGSLQAVDFFKRPLLDNRVAINFGIEYGLDPEALLFPTDEAWSNLTALPMGKNADMSKFSKHTTAKFSWGEADVFIGNNRIDLDTEAWPNHYVLSSGVFQFSTKFAAGDGYKPIPYHIYINVRPSVKPASPTYPFDIKREGWKNTIIKDIALLAMYLENVASGRQAEGIVDTFSRMRGLPRLEIEGIGTNAVDIDEFIRQKPKEPVKPEDYVEPPTPNSVDIGNGQVTGNYSDGSRKNLVEAEEERKRKEAEKNYSHGMETDVAAPKLSDFLRDIGIDSNLPVLHNNTTADYSAINPNADVFFAEIGSLMLAVRDKVGQVGGWAYKNINPNSTETKVPFFVGVSIDKDYHGVNILIPMQAAFLNPLAITGRTLPSIVKGLYDTMVHEFTHIPVRAHDTDFVSEFHALDAKLAADGFDIEMRVNLARVLKKHKGLFNDLRDKFEQSTTKNLGQSIHKGEKGGVTSTRNGARRTGEREGNTSNASRSSETGEESEGGAGLQQDAVNRQRRQKREEFPESGGSAAITEWAESLQGDTKYMLRTIPEFKKWWDATESGLKALGIEKPNVMQQYLLLEDTSEYPAVTEQVECK